MTLYQIEQSGELAEIEVEEVEEIEAQYTGIETNNLTNGGT